MADGNSDERAYLDSNGVLYLWNKIKAGFVAKVNGMTLTHNDLTDALKTKLDGIDTGAEVNAIDTIKVNGTTQAISNKAVDITVPTNNNQLTNGAGYQNASQVNAAIAAALADITGIKFEIVQTLPASGEAGTIYLVPLSQTATRNVYEEYIYISNAWEKLGTTDVDLTDYLKKTDVRAITNTELDNILT